jgi:cell division protein FtsL
MKSHTKVALSIVAFATVIALQSYVLYQQNKANLAVQVKMDALQNQLNKASETNSTLLLKVEELESRLEMKPRQLLSKN